MIQLAILLHLLSRVVQRSLPSSSCGLLRRQAESSYQTDKALCLSARMDNNSAQSLACLWRHDLAKACLTRAGRQDPSRLLPWMDPGGLFWQARLSHRDVIAMCQVARSRQSYRYRTVVWALQGGKCLESGLSNGCGPTCEGSGTHCLHRWSDIRQGPDLPSRRYRRCAMPQGNTTYRYRIVERCP